MIKCVGDITITSVERKIETDDANQISEFYGTFTDKWEHGVLVLDMDHRHFPRYFKSANHDWTNLADWERVDEATKAEVIAKHGSLKAATFHYANEDMKRVQAWITGKWEYLGIIYNATLEIKVEGKSFIAHEIASLFGIESDSNLEEYDAELLEELKSNLRQIGFFDDDLNFEVVNVP